MTHADRAVPLSGGPFGDHAAVAIVGESLADVAREALKMARVESLSRPVLLVDLLGQGSALDEMVHDENDLHGVSDAARYGISLNRVARQVPDADSLYVVPGGAESPQADDVLSDHLWGSWTDQCRRAGALLVVAAPADLPAVGKAIDQLDGLLMIGDGAMPATHTPLIGRVPGSRRIPPVETSAAAVDLSRPAIDSPAPVLEATSPVIEATSPAVEVRSPAVEAPTPREEISKTQRTTAERVAVAVAVIAVLAALAAGAWWWNARLDQRRPAATSQVGSVGNPIIMPGAPPSENAAGGAVDLPVGAVPWTVELASVNTVNGAMARVRQALDSLPVLTFAATQPGGGPIWYRLRAGAYASSEAADSLLTALRARGAIEPAAGRIVNAPLAWLLEENVLEDQLSVRLFLWRQQGLPAYALFDRNGTTRIYFGAFESEAEARLLTPMLDSLNLYATLVTRIGSVR